MSAPRPAQLLVDAVVAAVEVVDAVDDRLALARPGRPAPGRRRRAGRWPSPAAPESGVGPVTMRRAAVDADVRAHALQLGHVHVAVLEDRLRDGAGARRPGSSGPCTAPACRWGSRDGAAWSRSTALSVRGARTRRLSGPSSMRTPVSRNLSMHGAQVRPGWQLRISMSPPAMAQAAMKVPVSMRSGITVCSAPCEAVHALDADGGAARALDARAHRDQQVGQVARSPARRPRCG